jgi:SNF2 family DNA or RNA helicase
VEERETLEAILQAARGLEPLADRGFDAVDWPVAKFILSAPKPTARQIHCLWRLLRKYQGQLAGLGVEYSGLVPPVLAPLGCFEPAHAKRPEVKVYFVKTGTRRKLALGFDYDKRLVDVAGSLKEGFNVHGPKSWYAEESKFWIYPDDVESIRSIISAFESLEPTVDVVLSDKVKEFLQESEQSYQESRSETASLEVPTKLPLRPFQKAGVKWIDDRNGRALVADEAGVGKTPQALGYILLRKEQALPALVLCPANLRVNWVKETAKFSDLKCLIISAKTSLKSLQSLGLDVALKPEPGYDLTIMNYNLLTCETLKSWIAQLVKGDKDVQAEAVKEITLCGRRALPVLEKELQKYKDMETLNRLSRAKGQIEKLDKKARAAGAPAHIKPFANDLLIDEFMALGQFKTVIADESHYLMDSRSQRSLAAKRLSTRVKNVIELTGTPVLNKPMELWHQIQMIDPKLFPNFMDYGKEFCAAVNNGFGWNFSGASNLDKLEKLLRSTIMIRRMKDQVLKELPPKTRVTIPVAIEAKMAQYRKETKEPLQDLAKLRKDRDDWKALMGSMSVDERKKFLADHAEKAMAAGKLTSEILGRIEKLKQAAVNIKFDECLDFILNMHQQEGKILVFVAHHETTDRLMKAFAKEGVKADFIDGRVDGGDRERAKMAFQDGDLEILVCGIRAAGEGLTLTASHTVVMFECDWNPGKMDQAEARCHRQTQLLPVTIYYLVAFGTVEEKIVRMIDGKREVANAIMGESERTLSEDGILDALLEGILEAK